MTKCILVFSAILISFTALMSPSSAKRGVYAVTTTAQVADILNNIAHDDIRVESLMGTGVDPHLYRPTRSDIMKLRKADIVFYNGLHLEGQMIKLLETLEQEKPTIPVAARLEENFLLGNIPGMNTKHDPHIWMDVKAWINATTVTTDAMAKFDPGNAGHYRKKARIYTHKLELLDTHIANVIGTIPADARVLITAHDAFGYFGRAYGIEVIGVQGLSTESEAGLKRMEELVNLLVERKIPAVFAESSVTDRNINALIAGAKAKGHDVKLGGTLYSDAMGPTDTYEGTYIGMIEHNVRTLTKALGGTPDPFIYDDLLADARLID